MNLYQHTHLAQLQQHVDFETGLIDIDSFNRANIALADKQQAVVAYLKNEDANIAMLDDAIKQLQARKKVMQNRHDSLKDYLIVNMQANSITEITANDFTFSAKLVTNPPKIVIDNAEAVPGEFYIQPPLPPKVIDNAAIKAVLLKGVEIDGAHVERGISLRIK